MQTVRTVHERAAYDCSWRCHCEAVVYNSNSTLSVEEKERKE